MIVKSVRSVARVAGAVIDEEDRRIVGQAIVLLFAAVIAVLTAAGAAGLALQLFQLARGG